MLGGLDFEVILDAVEPVGQLTTSRRSTQKRQPKRDAECTHDPGYSRTGDNRVSDLNRLYPLTNAGNMRHQLLL